MSTKPGAIHLLYDGKLVVELKSLSATQAHKGNAVLDSYLKDFGLEIHGDVALSSIAQKPEHVEILERSIYVRMTRKIEKICQDADEQIQTESSKLDKLASGLLIILNEKFAELDPYTVARRIWDYTHARRTSIHYCLLIFHSHRISVNGVLKPYPLLLDLTYSARQRRSYPLVKQLQEHWAQLNGYPEGLPENEPKGEDFLPNQFVFGQ